MRKDFNLWRCRFCDHELTEYGICPFCNAPTEAIIHPSEWFEWQIEELDSTALEHLVKTLRLEQKNLIFYQELEERAPTNEMKAYFRHLRRVEEYHRDEVAGLLEIDYEELEIEELKIPDDFIEVLKKSKEVEKKAIEHYEIALSHAKEIEEEDLVFFYECLIFAENKHIDIFNWLKPLVEYGERNI